MKKNKWMYFLIMPVLLLMGVILSSCCSAKVCEVKVTLIGVDEDLDLESYSYTVEFNESTSISLEIPEGYDHTKIQGSIDDIEQEYSVEFEEEAEEQYQYSVNKTITYSIEFVKRDFEIKIDLTNMPKLTFDLNIGNDLSDFKVLVVDEEHLERLTELNADKVDSTIEFDNNSVTIDYGEHVFLLHNRKKSGTHYESLYANVTNFTPEKNKASIGTLNYSKYNISKKGNARYNYNNDSYSSLYYIGEIKEDIRLYSYIPGYTPDMGFNIDRNPNVFYLFTNLQEYNSEMCSIETYTTTTAPYNLNDNNLDKIGNVVIKKTTPSQKYKDRYDLHQVYLGQNLSADGLLSTNQKESINEDLYIKISSSIGINNLNFKLLNYERDKQTKYLLNADQVSEKGYTYIKLTKENMMDFSLERDKIDSYGQVHTYLSGSAIFNVEMKEEHYSADRTKYTRIWLRKALLDAELGVGVGDFHFAIYTKDGENKNYGFIDYHFEGYTRDCVYIETDLLFDENDMYKDSLYCDVWGEEYEDFKSVTIEQLEFFLGYYIKTSINPNRVPFRINNSKEFNGYKGFLIDLHRGNSLTDKDPSLDYTITVDINLKNPLNSALPINFSYLNIPNEQGNMVYITNNVSFDDLSDFNSVRYANRGEISSVYLSSQYDAYYFVKCASDEDFDFDIYLNHNDRKTKISSSKVLCDIVGNPLTIEINGEPFYVKVIIQDKIYEMVDGRIYAIEKES